MPLIGFYSSDCDSIQTMEAPGCPQKDPGFDQTGCSTWPGHDFSTTTPMTVSDGLRGGADTNCGYASYKFAGMDAVHQQLIDNATIDQAAHRTLRAIFQLGLLDPADAPGQHTHYTFNDVGTAAHKQLALEAAQQSLVLLQNPAKVLPLPRGKKIVVLGPHFNATSQMLGNYRGDVCVGETGAENAFLGAMFSVQLEKRPLAKTGAQGKLEKKMFLL